MYIKYEDLDMLEFFECDPTLIGEKGNGKYLYSIKDNQQFEMTFVIDVYEKKVDIFITFNNYSIFSGRFDNIIEIRKKENNLMVITKDGKNLVIKKLPCLGISIENGWE